MGKAYDELKRRFPDLADEVWAEAVKKAEAEVRDGLDDRIVAAVAAERESLEEEAEDVVLEIAAQREREFCGVLREIIEAICTIPGVVGEEENDDETEDQEETEEDEEESEDSDETEER
jgi:hypothetical protein